jgi:DNA-binding MarR family transcriptional regulator
VATPSVLDEVVERRSKSLFGNRHMLRVADDIAARQGRFTVQDVATRTQVPYSSAHRLVRQLESIGLVDPTPAEATESHRWYTRASHKFWDAAQELCATDKPVTRRGDKRTEA